LPDLRLAARPELHQGILDHGQFSAWVVGECDLSVPTEFRYMLKSVQGTEELGVTAPTTPALEDRPDSLSTAAVIGVCVAEILSLASYSIVPALLPQII
jgi:hypothetical protein